MIGAEQFFSLPNSELFLLIYIVWSLVWKGLALWKAARAGSKPWFIIILLLGTMGILEIIYIFAVKPKWGLSPKSKE